MSYTPVISGVTIEGTFGPYPAYIMGRSQSTDPEDTASIISINDASAYALETDMDLSFPTSDILNVTGVQVVANQRRYYGWTLEDFCIAQDFRGFLYLGSKSGSSNLSDVVIANVSNITCMIFTVSGTLSAETLSGSSYALLKSGAATTYVCPINVVSQQIYAILPSQYQLIKGNPYYEYPTLEGAVPNTLFSGTIPPEFMIYVYNTTTDTPSSILTQVGYLGNPFQDPTNPASSVLFSNPVGSTSSNSTVTTTHVTIGSATYAITIPYWFWTLFIIGAIITVVFIIVLIVWRAKRVKYEPIPQPERGVLEVDKNPPGLQNNPLTSQNNIISKPQSNIISQSQAPVVPIRQTPQFQAVPIRI